MGANNYPRILLLNPPRFHKVPVVRIYRSEYVFKKNNIIPPMDLFYFSQVAKNSGYNIKVIDANAEDMNNEQIILRIKKFAPDIIIVKGVLDILDSDLLAVKLYKNCVDKNVKVFLSCRSCMGIENLILKKYTFLDGILRGEVDAFAEDILGLTTDFFQVNGVVSRRILNQPLRIVKDLNKYPLPDLNAVPKDFWYKKYKNPFYGVNSGYYLIGSRGCPYPCTYCPVGGVRSDFGKFFYRRRKIENIIEEIKEIKELLSINDFYFFDEIFTFPEYAEEISKQIIRERLDVSWVCEGKVELVNQRMLNIMKRAGCETIYFGVESLDDNILISVRKNQTIYQIRKAFMLARKEEIKIGAYIVFGFPKDSWKTFIRLIIELLKLQPDFIRFSFLVPYPSTYIFEEMNKKNLFITKEFWIQNRHISNLNNVITFKTENLSVKELKILERIFKILFWRKLSNAP